MNFLFIIILVIIWYDYFSKINTWIDTFLANFIKFKKEMLIMSSFNQLDYVVKEEFSRDEVELARDIIRDTIQEWDRIIVR